MRELWLVFRNGPRVGKFLDFWISGSISRLIDLVISSPYLARHMNKDCEFFIQTLEDFLELFFPCIFA